MVPETSLCLFARCCFHVRISGTWWRVRHPSGLTRTVPPTPDTRTVPSRVRPGPHAPFEEWVALIIRRMDRRRV